MMSYTKRHRRLGLTLIAVAMVLVTGCANPVAVNRDVEETVQQTMAEHSEGLTEQTLLVVIDDPRSARRQRGGGGPGYSARFNYDSDPLLSRTAKAIAKDHQVDILLQWPIKNLGVHCFVVSMPDDGKIKRLEADARIRWTQPFNEFELMSVPKPATQDALDKPAPSFAQQFLGDIDQRGSGVDIAVIDTGADIYHPDLRSSNIRFRDFVGDNRQAVAEQHGTAVVGLIAAKAAEQQRVSGLAANANVHLLRGCWQGDEGAGRCNTLTLARALDAALDINPAILNLSLTGPADRVLQALINKLSQQGTLTIAAFDEQRKTSQRFPKPYRGVVYAYGVNHAAEQPIAGSLHAPRHALSLAPQAAYKLVSGHSIATPQLSAMAACLIERHPELEREQIVITLKNWLAQNY